MVPVQVHSLKRATSGWLALAALRFPAALPSRFGLRLFTKMLPTCQSENLHIPILTGLQAGSNCGWAKYTT